MPLRARALLVVAAALVAMACGGCGLATPGSPSVTVTVTHDFGGHQVAETTQAHVSGSETVTSLLQKSFPGTTQSAGGSVQSIKGLQPSGSGNGWFYFVNGVLGAKDPGTTSVHAGDHIWWDLHDDSATTNVPAVVGSFPEPFTNGIGGKRYPVTVECATNVNAACRRVTAAMNAAHVPASPQLLGTGSGPDTLGIVVGTWGEISSQVDAELVAYGPGASGVYARFRHGGNELQLLDAQGQVARTLTGNAGLIAATGDPSNVPTWMITGTTVAAVNEAAHALTAQALHNHFALAVDAGADIPVPVQGS